MRLLPLALLVLTITAAQAADPRGDTPDAPPQTPEQQRAQFHLPEGFEIQLVATEPDIQKPINLNFDAAGRLWVTGSELYPWPAATDAAGIAIPGFDKAYEEIANVFNSKGKAPAPTQTGRDSVRILSDFDAHGRARKIEVFADSLNIPSGVQPLPRSRGAKGDAAIVYSIPYIWRLEDRDGDGRAEHREILYGPFGFLDTHGGSSSYIYWMDGWIYGTHGFRNHSEVRDKTGRVVTLDSGNTYRFKPDGSRFEVYTHGQTNPFGLTFDPMGNLYSADSHSKPVYMLLRGGFYEGIGKQHDGLGFAPRITDDDHGSSAIAGIAYYADDKFPAEYRGNLFNGNPVTRRINRDKLEWHGSTPKAIRQPDFLTCDDPWFRPVQVKLGPDGALYIADFYNCIIGHYEFPLADPRRDHKHGRIWRVVYKGEGAAPAPMPNVAEADPNALVTALGTENLELRRLIVNELVDRLAKRALPALGDVVEKGRVFENAMYCFKYAEDAREYARNMAKLEPMRAALYIALRRLLPLMGAEGSPEHGLRDLIERRDTAGVSDQVKGFYLRSPAETECDFGFFSRSDDFLSVLTDDLQRPLVRRIAAESLATTAQAYRARQAEEPADNPANPNGNRPDEYKLELLARSARALLIAWDYNPPEDTQLIHSVRMALRDTLLLPGAYQAVAEIARINPQAAERLADVSLGAPTEEAADFLLDRLGKGQLTSVRAGDYVRHVALHLAEDRLPELEALLKNAPGFTPLPPVAVVDGFAAGLRKRNAKLTPETQGWIDSTIIMALASANHDELKRALTAARELRTQTKLGALLIRAIDADLPRDLRILALEATAHLQKPEEILVRVLNDPGDLAVRRKAADLLGQVDRAEARQALAQALPTAAGELALSIAGALVQRESGARLLLDQIAAGKASPTLLRNKLVALKIERTAPALAPRITELTANLPSEDTRLDQAIAARVERFHRAQQKQAGIRPIDLARGAQHFKTHCGPCHKFRNEGGNVGPNVDGVAARGVHRLIEDILDPNRNVDPAFRPVTIETTDGRTLFGVNPREEGENLLLTDATGATLNTPKAQVKSRTESRLSIMPPVFEQTLSPEDLNDLVAYLVTPAQ